MHIELFYPVRKTPHIGVVDEIEALKGVSSGSLRGGIESTRGLSIEPRRGDVGRIMYCSMQEY